jgi:pimeloyl-ACP methyl ester carboxylesterase
LPDHDGKTYVLVHGACHGGWCWRLVADGLRSEAHRVFTPTLTGLGERKHLLSRDITLDTMIADVSNVLEMEELEDVILVGHSFGGLIISGVADRMPERLRHLVYLDAMVLENGQSPFSILPADVVEGRRKRVAEKGGGIALPVPPIVDFGIPDDHPNAEWARRHLTPHPVGTYESPQALANPVGNGLPLIYIQCTEPVYAPLANVREWVKCQKHWQWKEIATGHDAMITAPEELTRMLLDIA